LKDLKAKALNKMISIPNYKSGQRNNQLTIIENLKSKINLSRFKDENPEISRIKANISEKL
jgi:hypothetical protein